MGVPRRLGVWGVGRRGVTVAAVAIAGGLSRGSARVAGIAGGARDRAVFSSGMTSVYEKGYIHGITLYIDRVHVHVSCTCTRQHRYELSNGYG